MIIASELDWALCACVRRRHLNYGNKCGAAV